MSDFPVYVMRDDPYKNFKFLVKWDGRYVAGVSRVSALIRNTEVIEFRDGSDPSSERRLPGRTTYEPITLSRGVTHDREFEQWANEVWKLGAGLGSEAASKAYRKDVTLDVLDESGHLALSYKIHRAWVSKYEALPDLEANSDSVALESITLEHEGWERDEFVPEPGFH